MLDIGMTYRNKKNKKNKRFKNHFHLTSAQQYARI